MEVTRDTVTESIECSVNLVKEYVNQALQDSLHSTNPVMRYVTAYERLSAWGSHETIYENEAGIHNAVRRGLGYPTLKQLPDSRPLYVLGTWTLDQKITVTSFMMAPGITTATYQVDHGYRQQILNGIDQMVVVEPSSTCNDKCKYISSQGGSVAGGMSTKVLGHCNEVMHRSIHENAVLTCLGFTSLPYIVRVGCKVMLCSSGPETTAVYMSYKDPNIAAISTLGWANIHAVESTDPGARSCNAPARYRPGSKGTGTSGNVKITANGSVRYSGRPWFISAAFSKFKEFVRGPMRTRVSAYKLLKTLSVVSALSDPVL